MTPAARWAAAAQILDNITAGQPAEKALTNWARRSRFAGSKDRAAIRDHVFDILRCWRSAAALGGGSDGRRLVLGRLRQLGLNPDDVFTGLGHAMVGLTAEELSGGVAPEGAAAADLPDWIFDIFLNDFENESHVICEELRHRAPVFLRVNSTHVSREDAQRVLAEDGIVSQPHQLSETALEVIEGGRRIAQSQAYQDGMVEIQDVASQAVVDALPLRPGMRVLDYCAGGGGKTLGMAARTGAQIDAHDANFNRMNDLPKRATRAGARINIVPQPRGPYDLVLCDVPCSGSGAWRRSPEGKWRLTPQALEHTQEKQAQILDIASELVGETGFLAYATCSLFRSENEDQIAAFLTRAPGWSRFQERRFAFSEGGDGFFLSVLTRNGRENTT